MLADAVPIAVISAVENAKSKTDRRMNDAVRNKLARFLRTVVVENKTDNLFLDELEIRLRMEFLHSLTNMHNPKTLAAFLGNVVRNAFPGITLTS